jgi:hypothetical protein
LHIYHFGSVVTRKGPDAEKFKVKQAAAYGAFKQKWGFDPINQPGYNIKFPPNTKTINGITFPTPKITEQYLEWEYEQ